ncbi:hypothetical protein A374_10595 [Fictibacillus macauensis ZFHKF-1]|uniref:LysM domain-containing protein n=2 Tax=Fictibacillus TaxID=1329200 RepID=I8UE51_9BACL|nr:hypothetical protein A374_10595 [Fictibacillus macauensis ZFHKF-1]
MKKLFLFGLGFLLLYIIAYDLKIGTLPSYNFSASPSSSPVKMDKPYKQIKTGEGDTVLSIIEKLNPSATSLPITKVIKDFQKLNGNLRPENIRAGKIYNFPIYKR